MFQKQIGLRRADIVNTKMNATDARPLRLAIAGLGTVGMGLIKLLRTNQRLVTARAGRSIDVVAISARDRNLDRGLDLSGLTWFDDPVAMALDANIDVFVELIGGSEGAAKDACEAALAAGRDVVTANKALIAHHGASLAELAEKNGRVVAYEAAVAGGIPIIKSMREGLSGNAFSRVYGILNGTCNYILSTMRKTSRNFDDVLSEAQSLGYAEADPSFDIDGVDTAHKLAILASLAFGSPVNFDAVHIEGIRHISLSDIHFAEELGYRIKLLGIASRTDHGIEQRVHPCMVPVDAPIAHVEGAFNAVVAHGDFVDTVMQVGPGAGAGPTASAVVADIIDIGQGRRTPTFGVPFGALQVKSSADMGKHHGAYYVRLMVIDKPGVFADVAAALRDNEISMEAVLQRAHIPGETVPVVLTTHEANEAAMRRTLDAIGALDAVPEPPRLIRIGPF
jgi:homoserine dehydrogenase